MDHIETPRLILRRYADTPADVDAAFALYGAPETLQFISLPLKTREQAQEFVARQAALDADERKAWHAYVICLSDGGTALGEVGMFIASEEEASGDVGFMLRPDARGHGYATEAAAAITRYGFERWQLRRVTGGCDARNIASQRVLERTGLQLVEGGSYKGQENSLQYQMWRDEWLACRQR